MKTPLDRKTGDETAPSEGASADRPESTQPSRAAVDEALSRLVEAILPERGGRRSAPERKKTRRAS